MQMVLDALRARKDRFSFEGTDIQLRSSVMAFITMNPGYPGRAELPESLKVIYPSIAYIYVCGVRILDRLTSTGLKCRRFFGLCLCVSLI